MANPSEDEAKSATVNQKSFVTSLKKHVLVPSNPISGPTWTIDKQQKVLLNYWAAINQVLAEGDDAVTVLFKTNGLHLFHAASSAVFLHLANRQDFTQHTIVAILKHGFDNLPTEFLGMAQPQFGIVAILHPASTKLLFGNTLRHWLPRSTHRLNPGRPRRTRPRVNAAEDPSAS